MWTARPHGSWLQNTFARGLGGSGNSHVPQLSEMDKPLCMDSASSTGSLPGTEELYQMGTSLLCREDQVENGEQCSILPTLCCGSAVLAAQSREAAALSPWKLGVPLCLSLCY